MSNNLVKVTLSLLVNIAIPAVILSRFSSEAYLGPGMGLVAALIFPLGYGLAELWGNRKVNALSVIGLLGVLLTGGIGLFHFPTQWLAIKEALVPLAIGSLVLISAPTRFSVTEKLLEQVLRLDKIYQLTKEAGHSGLWRKKLLITSYIVSTSFGLSAVLNYLLATYIVTSPAGTVEFNKELSRLTLLSYPAIALPSMVIFVAAVMYLLNTIEKLTGSEAAVFLKT